MTLPELKKSISEKKPQSLYIFTGAEIAVMDIYIKKIASMFPQTMYAESLQSIIPKLKSNSLISNEKTLYVMRDDKSISSAEKIWTSMKTSSLQKTNSLLFTFTTLDKRGKFYKAFDNYITYFEPLSSQILLKYINKEVQISQKKAEFLINITNNNYNKILLETDKIKNLSAHLHITDDEAFDMCVKHNAFYIPPDGDIFELLNAILSRDVRNTNKQLEKFKRRGDSPLAILSLLHTNIKALLQLQCADGMANIGKVTGLNGFQINNLNPFKNKYSTQELIRILTILHYCDKAVKQTGSIDQDILLDFLLVKIF